ncbi:MAG TPA: NADH-quinone oxidoreductase subunit L [Flavobacteriales bacterium]|nr:NADH-quinone oxidoreductase subunit L [Flavobacteriales bacterium]
MALEKLIPLVPLFPLLGFIITGLFGKKMSKGMVGIIASGAILCSFAVTVLLFMKVHDTTVANVFTFINVGDFQVNFSFQADNLSIWMMLIITGIGFLIHVYSTGYMHEDEGFYKFFAYLNLFVFSMLLLVMGSNYVMMFFGWEGVGLCSYLLIGFWYDNKEYGKAARKAFIMNRIGDLGLLMGLFLIYANYGSFEYKEVFDQVSAAGSDELFWITICLFIGAMGKSAQIPLYTWLPDAMAGPTPVSALIHAATMVTAGIYMITRSSALFEAAPYTKDIILWVGLATSLFAAVIGLRQNDIKKVLAYSTVSQLGLMFIALGLGSYTSAMFHLTTHAFFKALLFLGSGSVIHAMGGEQDIRKMGGLKSHLKITHATFLIGTLAIIGFPLLSGFYSKDEILAHAFVQNKAVWLLTMGSAAITGIYMLRMYFLTFHGTFRGTHEQEHHLHESPASMTFPLIILAGLSLLGGALNTPGLIMKKSGQWMAHHLADNTDKLRAKHPHLTHNQEWLLMLGATIMVAAIIYFLHKKYVKDKALAEADDKMVGWEKASANKFWVDELYDMLFVKPIAWLSSFAHNVMDNMIVDGIVRLAGKTVTEGSKVVRLVQSGNIEFYLFGMVAGIILILLFNFLI